MKRYALLSFLLAVTLAAGALEFDIGQLRYETVIGAPTKVAVTGLVDYNYYGAVTVPSEVTYNDQTYTVIHIGEEAFEYSYITSIKLPNTIASIQANAFYYCCYLENIELPNGLTSIGENAFYYLVKWHAVFGRVVRQIT